MSKAKSRFVATGRLERWKASSLILESRSPSGHCSAAVVEIPIAEAGSGDVLAFRWRARYPAKHVGILVERDRLIHAFEFTPVMEIRLTPWWWRHAAAAFRFPSAASQVPDPSP
mgnify:CR=1 FL=1